VEPDGATILWLQLAKTAPVTVFSGYGAVGALPEMRLGRLLKKLVLEPLKKPCQQARTTSLPGGQPLHLFCKSGSGSGSNLDGSTEKAAREFLSAGVARRFKAVDLDGERSAFFSSGSVGFSFRSSQKATRAFLRAGVGRRFRRANLDGERSASFTPSSVGCRFR